MRVWDVNPGYLNRQSLLGEHREIHGMISILANGKRGYSRHPETKRWRGHLWAARQRHDLLVAEMTLRGFLHHSPAPHRGRKGRWPERFVDPPSEQFRILRGKYVGREPGRIPLPARVDQLWAQHKYSVLARDPVAYRRIGRRVAQERGRTGFEDLARELVHILRQVPGEGRLRNALQHMVGYTSGAPESPSRSSADLLGVIVARAEEENITYLLHSTALCELSIWAKTKPRPHH